MTLNTSRRNFLVGAGVASTALFVGLGPGKSWAAADDITGLNPFIRVDSDGIVTAIVKHFEMGQGTTTGLTTLIAEELDADWEQIQIDFAPANDKLYANLLFGSQGTGGSTAIANSYLQYRKAGAAAREILVKAAAIKWGVSPAGVSVKNGILSHGDKTAHFGEVLQKAVTLSPSKEPRLKSKEEFTLIGNPNLNRKDSAAKTNGTAIFAMDVKVPGMVYACVAHSPKFGATVTSFSVEKAKGVAGFIDAKMLPTKTGVVVYAKNTWAAKQARGQLDVSWDDAQAETRSTQALSKAHADLLGSPQHKATKSTDFGKTGKAIEGAEKVVEADFFAPFLAHEPMEPLNCVIEPTENGVRLHDGCQFPGITKPTLAAILKLKPEQVEIKTVYAGGSFGRRATPEADYQVEAGLA